MKCPTGLLRGAFAALGLVLVLGSSARLTPEDELTGTRKKANDTGAVTIGCRESWLPFSYLNGLKQPIGYAIDLCQDILGDMAHELGRDDLKIDSREATFSEEFAPSTRPPICSVILLSLNAGSNPNHPSAGTNGAEAPATQSAEL